MNRLNILLLNRFDRDCLFIWASDGIKNTGGIVKVVFIAYHKVLIRLTG
jgi:hypothetical protein